MLKEKTRKGTCPRCKRPYVAFFQVDDAARTTTPMATVDCPHKGECNAAFHLRIPTGAVEATLKVYTPSAWAALRKTLVPKPLTEPELAQLELQSDIAGLSTVDVRRLLADNRRVRDNCPDESTTKARRRSTAADAPGPLTDKELAEFERAAITFRRALRPADQEKDPGKAVIEPSFAVISARLVGEIRRLRQLVIDAEPYVPDNEQTRTMNLPARLKAEVDR
jgi:hypothetical protein